MGHFLGSLDANTQVMTLKCFRAETRQGHFDRSKIVVSYLAKFKLVIIRIIDYDPNGTHVCFIHATHAGFTFPQINSL